jgi:L-seryl-tRNA(Ser) seleniumtransferase
LILGRRDLITACAANANPNHAIGRPMKAGKEEIVGLLVALELYLAESEDERQARWEEQVRQGIELLQGLAGLHPRRVFPMPTGKWVPRILVELDGDARLSADEVRRALRNGIPSIEVRPDPAGFVIDPQNLQPGEMERICARIVALWQR